MIITRNFLIIGILLLVTSLAGCTGGESEDVSTIAAEAPVTTPPPTTTPPVVTTLPPTEEVAEEVDYTKISFYDEVGDAYVDGKFYLDYKFYGNTKDGEIIVQHADIPTKEATMLGEPKYILEFEGVVSGNPLKKTFQITETELFGPELILEVKLKP